jgi:hypothetical protein
MDDSQGGSVLEVKAPAVVKATSEVRNNIKETFDEAQERVVYVMNNRKPLGAVIGLKHLKLLEAALEREAEERLAAIAEQRYQRYLEGKEELLDEEEFRSRLRKERKR